MTDAAFDAVLAKVRKLLALAGNHAATEGEATNAAAAAQRLMDEHRIDAALLDTGPEEERVEEHINVDVHPVDRSKRIIRWRGVLAGGVCRANGCRHYWEHRGGYGVKEGVEIRIVGHASRVTSVRYLYAYLSREIDRLGAEAARGKGRAYGHAWRVGCASRVGERLVAMTKQVEAEAKTKALAAGFSLARIESAIVPASVVGAAVALWTKEHLGLRSLGRIPMKSASGYEAGKAAGDRIKLGGHAALGQGSKRLGSGS